MSGPDLTRTGPGTGIPEDATRSRSEPGPDGTWSIGGTSTAVVPPAIPPGYEIVGELGRGGMGVVYHVRHAKLNRPAALKTTLAGEKPAAKDLIRFLAEAEAVAAVRHPNVVQVYDYGDVGGRPFLALELCPNGTLSDKLRAAVRLPPRVAADLVAKLARAVQAAHDQGIVHRDLKPSNVLFDSVGEPKVTDFGLAKRTGGSDLTKSHAVMGTPAYMSPEQARGETKFVGPPADVWALGVVLYECLTGRRPFAADDSWALLQKVMAADPEPLPADVPRDLALITRTCLAKAPHERYPTAQALADDLGRFLDGLPISVRPAGAVERTVKWVKRNPFPAALVASLFLGTTAATALAVYATREADRADQEASNAQTSLLNEKSAASRADAEARTARAKAAEAQRLLGIIATNEGVRLQNRSDHSGAALLFARALETDPDNTAAVTTARERIANAVRLAPIPKLEQMVIVPEGEKIVAVSVEANRAASVRPNGTGRVWNIATAKPLAEFSVPNLEPGTVTFSPDGTRLFAASQIPVTVATIDPKPGAPLTKTLRPAPSVLLIDSDSGKSLPTPPAPEAGIANVQFSPDGSRLVLAGPNEVATVWDVPGGRVLIPTQRHNPVRTGSPFDETGNHVLLADAASARVFDAKTGRPIGLVLPPEAAEIRRAVLSPDGDRLGFVFNDSTVQVWNLTAGEPTGNAFPVDGVPDSIAFFPGGDVLVTSSDGVRRWDDTTGEPQAPLVRAKEQLFHATISSDGRWFVVSDLAGRIYIHASDDGSELARTPPAAAHINGLTLSPDGRRVLVSSYESTVTIWGPSQHPDDPDGPPGATRLRHEAPVRIAAPSADGRRLTTVSGHRVLRTWAFVPADGVHRPVPEMSDRYPRFRLAAAVTPYGVRDVWKSNQNSVYLGSGPDGPVVTCLVRYAAPSDVRFVHDGRAVVAHLDPNRVQAWSAADGKPLGPVLSSPGPPLGDFQLSPDFTKWLIVTGNGVRVWDVATGRPLGDLIPANTPANSRHAYFAQFGPDSDRFILFWSDGLVQFRQLSTGQVLWSQATNILFSPLQFTPDGRNFLAFESEESLRVLSTETGLPACPSLTHPALCFLGAVGRNSRYVMTSCSDNEVRVWDITTGRRVGPPIPCTNPGGPMAFSSDGRHAMIPPAENSARLYEVETGQPMTPTLAVPDLSGIWPDSTGYGFRIGHDGHHFSVLARTPDSRPNPELVRLCELLAGHRVDDTGTFVPLSPEELADRWTDLSKTGASELSATPADRFAWHRANAAEAAIGQDWHAAAFHFRQLAALDPANGEWARRWHYARAGEFPLEIAPLPRRKGR